MGTYSRQGAYLRCMGTNSRLGAYSNKYGKWLVPGWLASSIVIVLHPYPGDHGLTPSKPGGWGGGAQLHKVVSLTMLIFFAFTTFSLSNRELEEARENQNNLPRPKIGLGTQCRNSRIIGQKVNRSMSLSVLMWILKFYHFILVNSGSTIDVSGHLNTYPSPKSTWTLTFHLEQNCD